MDVDEGVVLVGTLLSIYLCFSQLVWLVRINLI